MKKIITGILVLCLMCSLVACSSKAEGTYVVGICQLTQHDALDAATKGFKDALVEEFGDKVTFDEANASGEVVNCTTIVNGFISKKVDLILANATPALTAAVAATDTIPILGTAVTSYSAALEIADEDWTGVCGGNVSGTSDIADLKAQAEMFPEWVPDAKHIGLLYCSAEANSLFQVAAVETYFAEMGYTTERFTFTDSNDVASVTQKACDACDAIFVPTDNTAASNTEAIANIVIPSKTPVITGESSMSKGCGVATISINYYDLGVATGKMAAKILKGEADISTMPVEYSPELYKFYNPDVCEALGITPIEGYEILQ